MKRILDGFWQVSFPIILAILLSSLLFLVTGYSIKDVWSGILQGAISSPGSFEQTLRWTVPLLIIALGIAISLRTGEFNIGAQGQLMMGGLASVSIALTWPTGPVWLVVPIALIAAMIFGALWSGISGFLKIRMGADEVITTLMLNFIAVLVIQWVTTGPLKNEATRGENASTELVEKGFRLSTGSGTSTWVFIITIAVILIAWMIIERSSFGFKSKLTGSNPVAAAWQGINTQQVRYWTYLLTGAFAGLAGAIEVLGPNGRLVTGATPSIGFTAIVVAIVGFLRVPGIVLAALFFGGLQAAILFLPIVSNLPTSGIRILEGLVALLITARFVWVRKQKKNPNVTSSPTPPPATSAVTQEGI